MKNSTQYQAEQFVLPGQPVVKLPRALKRRVFRNKAESDAWVKEVRASYKDLRSNS